MRIVYLAECLAYLSLILLPGSVLFVRLAPAQYSAALLCFALSALLALIAIGISAVFTRRQPDNAHRRRLSRAAVLSTPAIGFFAFSLYLGSGSPMIHDISTDTEDPPQFVQARQLRSDYHNTLAYTDSIAEQQRLAYPALQSLTVPRPLAEAQTLALRTVEELGWTVTASSPGHIEATDQSFWFGFIDDVVIRIEADSQSSTIDLRSASRVGKGDLGANARRIQRFLTHYRQSLN